LIDQADEVAQGPLGRNLKAVAQDAWISLIVLWPVQCSQMTLPNRFRV
jgi:hypothetical protein